MKTKPESSQERRSKKLNTLGVCGLVVSTLGLVFCVVAAVWFANPPNNPPGQMIPSMEQLRQLAAIPAIASFLGPTLSFVGFILSALGLFHPRKLTALLGLLISLIGPSVFYACLAGFLYSS